jgi:Alternative complex III, ActD subunit/Heat induced stress protein YflT domain
MRAIYGLYSTPYDAQRAVDSLRGAGLGDREITVLSSEPLEEFEFAQRDNKTWMTWIAAGGGLLGLLTGYFLTSLTQKAWALNTGGMPIVTNWTNLIVIFELTMLGGVFASVITLLITARIPGRGVELYDPEIADGKILIGVTNPRNDAHVRNALLIGEDTEIRTVS